MSSSALYEFIL